MIRIFLDKQAEPIRPLILDLLLYNDIHDVNVEVSSEQKFDNSIFIDLNEYENLEDVMSEFAMRLHPMVKRHARTNIPSQIWLSNKHGESKSRDIVSVIETAVEPNTFFDLEKYTI